MMRCYVRFLRNAVTGVFAAGYDFRDFMGGTDFQLFGVAHLAILAAVALAAIRLSVWGRKDTRYARSISGLLALLLVGNEVIWYTYRYFHQGLRFPEGMPLQLCDVTVWMAATALLMRKQWVFETAFLIGVAGAGMALLTPDLWFPFWSYPTLYFFVAHGLIVVAVLFLALSRQRELHPGCVWRVFAALNVYALLVGTFNAIFHTNYVYLCRKPQGASVLNYFGPWPWYIVVGEVVAVAVLWMLWRGFDWALRRR